MAYLGEEMKKHSILIGILTGLLISSGVLAQSEVVWATEFAWTNQQQAILATDSLQRIYLATQIFNPEAISLFGATLPIDQGDIPPDETTSATIDASGGVLELPSQRGSRTSQHEFPLYFSECDPINIPHFTNHLSGGFHLP